MLLPDPTQPNIILYLLKIPKGNYIHCLCEPWNSKFLFIYIELDEAVLEPNKT